ncbi:MAG: DUF1727 domain-containing protein [Chloroflexi bacterium]|nr:DUF1727 domain-containing protein [Chloroflexota bacterium]
MKAKQRLAILCGKMAGMASRLAGGGGTTLPGWVAQAIHPSLVSYLVSRIPQGVTLVTGTNGKTTTSRLLATILSDVHFIPIYNRAGSNLMRGIATALVSQAHLDGHFRQPNQIVGLFEVDEATLPRAIRETQPKVVVATNLFRDQLDRYGELDSLAQSWSQAFKELPQGATLVLNGDDPLLAHLGHRISIPIIYYGLETEGMGTLEHAADSIRCPTCGNDFQYSAIFYGHLGHYCCRVCGTARPLPQVRAFHLCRHGIQGYTMELGLPGGGMVVELGLPGLYNVYNAAAAAAAAAALGIPHHHIQNGLKKATAAFGRLETLSVQGRRICLILAKNPVGFNEALRIVDSDKEARHLLLVLNDRIADGRDVSWIWDVDFETLLPHGASIVVSGLRAEDMAIRLKYAVPEIGLPRVKKNLREALYSTLEATSLGDTIYIIPTYTAMLEVRAALVNMGYVSHPLMEEG